MTSEDLHKNAGDTNCDSLRTLSERLQALFLIMNRSAVFVFIHSFIQSVVCLATGPLSPPKRFFHRGRSSASAFNSRYPLFSLRSSSSCLRLLSPRHCYPSLYLSFNNMFIRHFLRKMWPIQLLFLPSLSTFIVYGILLSSVALYNTSSFLTLSIQLIFSILIQHHISTLFRYFSWTFPSAQLPTLYKAKHQT